MARRGPRSAAVRPGVDAAADPQRGRRHARRARRATGLARSTIAQRLEQLLAHGLLREAGESESTGGRPPMLFAFNEDAGVVLAADLGATHSRLAVTDLGGAVLAEEHGDIEIAAGPERGPRLGRRALPRPAARDRPRRRRRARHRHRRPGPGRARDRAPAQPADHARLGRLPDPRAVRRPLQRPGARRQRRQHHGPRRALDQLARRSTTCSSSRSAPGSAAGSSSTATSTAAPTAPPATSATSASPATRPSRSSAPAGTSAASRRSPAAARWRRGCARRGSRPPTRAQSSSWRAPASLRRCGWCASPAG